MRTIRRAWLLSAAAAGIMVLALPGVAGAQTDSGNGPTLGGWTAISDANALDVLVDSPAGLAGSHPISEVDLPEAYSDFETGPFGTGRASVLYPGSVLANFGSASGEFNLGTPAQLQPIVGKLNDPVVAVSSYPGGPASATYPSSDPAQGEVAEMSSQANENGVQAASALTDTNLDGLLSVSGVKSTSSSTATDVATATATTRVGDLSILGGLVEITGIGSTTTATSNGTTATVSGHATPVTVSIAGYQVGLDDQGINLGPVSEIPLTGGLVTAQLNQLISALGLKISLLPQTQTVSGADATVESAGVQVSFTLPAALSVPTQLDPLLAQLPSQLALVATLPQLFQQGSFTFTVGRSTSTADASPPFAVNIGTTVNTGTTPHAVPTTVAGGLAGGGRSGGSSSGGGQSGDSGDSGGTNSPGALPATTLPDTSGDSPALAAGAGDDGDLGSSGGAPASVDTPISSDTSSPAASGTSSTPTVIAPSTAALPTATTTVAAPAPGSSQIASLAAVPISLSSPVGAGVVALVILSTVAIGYGLRRLAGRLDPAATGPPCPLEEESP